MTKNITIESTATNTLTFTEDQINEILAMLTERKAYFTALLAKLKAQLTDTAVIKDNQVL